MTSRHLRLPTRRRAAALGALVALTVAAGALLAACGSSNAATTGGSTSATGGRTAQVLYTVRLGNLIDSATGRAQLASTKSKTNVKIAVQVMGPSVSQVAAGQSVALTFFKLPAGASSGSGGTGGSGYSGGGSGYSGGGSGYSGGGSGYSGGGSGYSGGGFSGQGRPGLLRGGKTAKGTVTSVSAASNGAVTAIVTIAKLPVGVTSKFTGIAQIQVKVLASNVLIVPKAAIKGSAGSATVQLLVNGKTQTQSVTVGQQTATEAEITSGLSAGQNVIYTRRFGFPGGGSHSGQFGAGGGYFQSGGQAAGTQSSSTTSGT